MTKALINPLLYLCITVYLIYVLIEGWSRLSSPF